jgi:hypothetical protein
MEFEATPANTVIFTGTTLLNGIYTDLGEDYVFLPEFAVTDYPEVAAQLEQEHIAVYEMDSYDPNAAPFCFMINGLCRVFRCELDELKVGDEG